MPFHDIDLKQTRRVKGSECVANQVKSRDSVPAGHNVQITISGVLNGILKPDVGPGEQAQTV